jgi:hypothetical protein
LNAYELRKFVINEHTKLTAALSSDGWMKLFPGKIIFNRFCGEVFQVESASVREAYTDIAMRTKREVFQDIIEILEGFSQIAAPITY